METVKITHINADYKDIRSLYETAFPKEEQIPYNDLRYLLKRMPLDFTAYYDNDMFVGLTIVLERDDFNWFWYFAVKEELRGNGYGQQILTLLKEKYADKPLILDMESPEQQCDNKEQRRRRHAFYLRNGFHDTYVGKSFAGIDYTILMLGDRQFTQMDYDNIIKELRYYWDNIPKEDEK